MSEREQAVMRLAITSVLCLNLEHVTLLRGEEFGLKPSAEVIGRAVRDCTELLNGVLGQHGSMSLEDDYVGGFVEAAWNQVLEQRDQRTRNSMSTPFSPLSPD
jgi:hypothetical protein